MSRLEDRVKVLTNENETQKDIINDLKDEIKDSISKINKINFEKVLPSLTIQHDIKADHEEEVKTLKDDLAQFEMTNGVMREKISQLEKEKTQLEKEKSTKKDKPTKKESSTKKPSDDKDSSKFRKHYKKICCNYSVY